jgi:hypothetical protein
MTKLTNSQGKQLYNNPENIKKAMKRRKDNLYCKGLLKVNLSLVPFTRSKQVVTA